MANAQEDNIELGPYHPSNTPNSNVRERYHPPGNFLNLPYGQREGTQERDREPSERNPEFDFDVNRPNMAISAHRKFARHVYVLGVPNQEQHANKIVSKMEREDALMEDTPLSEQLRK